MAISKRAAEGKIEIRSIVKHAPELDRQAE
jgi:hypothetical protein